MTWLNPSAFAFLAGIPVLLLLHALRYRRRDVQVSTLFLWDRVMREAQGTLGLRRLVQNIPLLLQVLLVCLLSVALARPALTTAVAQNKDIVLVLDVSASMQTRTPHGERFRQAQQHALTLLETLPGDRQMAIIAAGRQPQVASFFTSEKALLRQTITGMQVTDAPGNMREAILLALSFAQGSRTHEVVLIGDGAYRQIADLDLPQQRVRHIQVTGGDRNVGITRLAFRKVLESEEQYEALLTVKNFSRQPIDVPVRLTVRQQRLLERQLTLSAGQEESMVTALAGPLKGVAQAELLVEDDLALDNRAYGVLETPAQTWILLVGETNFFLERLLTALPGVLVNVIPEVTETSLPRLLEANRLLIFNGVQPPPVRQGNYLLLHTAPQDPRLTVQGVVTRPQVLDWDRQHPLLRFVDLADVHIEEALILQPQGSVRSLVDGTRTSLLSVLEEPRLRLVTLAFDLMRSDLPVRVAFPVLISNILRWIGPQQSELIAGHVQAGMAQAFMFDPPVERVTVQDPQGKNREYAVQGNPWVFHDTERIGVYIMRAGEQKHYLTVNLLDETESDIAPAEPTPSLTPTADPATFQPAGIAETPLWPYVLLGAVFVLAGEWYVWCRDM